MITGGNKNERGIGAAVFTIVALVIIGAVFAWYVQYTSTHQPRPLELTAEAKQYVHNLKLSEVQMKANESYMKQLVVEIDGKITNTGDRTVKVVDLHCVFYDAYGQLVLRERVPIVNARMGALKPGEMKPFRLPFDTVPESWNHQMPSLVIAGIQFQ